MPAGLLAWLVVLLVILFVGFIRVRLLDMPLERDEGEYAYAGQLILQGIPPYELAYNMKLPGTYYAYALGMAVFGESCAGVHLTVLVTNTLTTIFVFFLARKLFGTMAGVVGCASYGVMAASPYVLGMAAHASHFVVLFAVPATLLLLKAEEDKQTMTLFLSGLFYGLAFLMEQHGICFCLFGCFFLTCRAVMGKSIFSIGFLKTALTFGLGICLPFCFLFLTCLVAGDFTQFWFWTFIYAHNYVSLVSWSDGRRLLFEHLQQTWKVSLPFWVLAVAALPLGWLNKTNRVRVLFAGSLWFFSFLGVAVGMYFRPHYFILLLPAFAVLTGAAVASLQRILHFSPINMVLQSVPMALFVAIFGWAVYCQAPRFFLLSPVRVCEIIYPGNPFVESLIVAGYIRTNSAPDARIAVVGSEPEIYFYARRHSATGYIYTYALMEPQPAASAMQEQMIQEIELNKPEYLVAVSYGVSWLIRPRSNRLILDWLQPYARRYYEPVGLVRRNSAGEIESDWGNLAANQNVLSGEYIVVFKLKPKEAVKALEP